MLKSVKSKLKSVKSLFISHIPYTPKQQALLKTLMFAALLVTINYCFGQDGNSGAPR